MSYDIIGDIHGHADELEVLLQKLGYQLKGGTYSNNVGRKVVFLGDFIDRGPKIREVLHIVKNMCDNGHAMAIMGNHEFNAISFHTRNKKDGGFYRKHNFSQIRQHYATLEQFHKFPEEWSMFLQWFKQLPIYLEIADFRAVHACWDQVHIDWLKENFKGFTDQFIEDASNKKNNAYIVIEELLKGKESPLSKGLSFKDKDGTERFDCRIKWWQPNTKRQIHRDIMMECPAEIAEKPLIHNNYYDYSDDKVVFFGHYWLKGKPIIENNKAICLDYSVAKEGLLVAYRSEFLNSEKLEEGFDY